MKTLIANLRKWVAPITGSAVLLVLILFVGGAFTSGRIEPENLAATPGLPKPERTAQVAEEMQSVWYEAVGSVQSRTRTTVAAQIASRILEVNGEAGGVVKAGELLVVLDDQEIKARLEQTRSALAATRAADAQARSAFARVEKLFRQEAATQEQFEAGDARRKGAAAEVAAAEQKLNEAQVALGYARIQSPAGGVIAERLVEPGDMAFPGKPLLALHDAENLRLEAQVREGLIGHVKIGSKVEIELTTRDETVVGEVVEVVPSADPVSRSFLVKAALPKIEGLYPGMFGKLRVRLGERPTILVPDEAIARVGQLTTVIAYSNERWSRRYVTVGALIDGHREILSGLSSGDTVGWSGEARDDR
ncbi:MAG: HlyD family secretion protein [Candidatus Binatia bacterium]|jgi:HlyD family secretion protein